MFQHNVWNTCIWMYLVLSNTLNEIYLTYPTCQPHIPKKCSLHASPRGPTGTWGRRRRLAATFLFIPVTPIISSWKSPADPLDWIRGWAGSGFIQGTSPLPRCSPWCWNMNPNIYPKKITQFCRFLYTSTMVRIWVLMSIFCSDQKWESWKLPDWSKVLKTQHHCVINAFWPPLNQIHSRSAISSGVSGRLIPIFCWSISPHFAGARCPFLFHEIRQYQF